MRSDMIFRAKVNITNKYELCQTAAKATRRLHISSTDTQQTISNAFARIAIGSAVSDAVLAVPVAIPAAR